ncbi:hypothetical protein [Actinomycetospora chlora]|uniref:hypothetical protein n=1 Tax=Actinomycetospora chlora TaxID=663608 RepID=UPI0031F16647
MSSRAVAGVGHDRGAVARRAATRGVGVEVLGTGGRRWRAGRESVLRTRATLLLLAAYVVLVAVLAPFHPPEEFDVPRGAWPDDLVLLGTAVLGGVVVAAAAVRALRLVTAITLFDDGSVLLAAPLRSVTTHVTTLRRLQRVRLVADELVTGDTTVRLAGGMLRPELIEALTAVRPGLEVTAAVAVAHPLRPSADDEPDPPPEDRADDRPRPPGAVRAAPVRSTLARRASTRSGEGWGPPERRGPARRGTPRSGRWTTPGWWTPTFVALFLAIAAWCIAVPVGLVLTVPGEAVITAFGLVALGGAWGIYPLITLRWAFLATSVDLARDGTLVVSAPAATRTMPVTDVWVVRARTHVARNGRRRPPVFLLETATGVLLLPNRLVDHDLLDVLAAANPLMLVPRRET